MIREHALDGCKRFPGGSSKLQETLVINKMVNIWIYLNKNFVSNCVIFKMTKILERSFRF